MNARFRIYVEVYGALQALVTAAVRSILPSDRIINMSWTGHNAPRCTLSRLVKETP